MAGNVLLKKGSAKVLFFNSLEYFVLKIRHIAKAQPLQATLTDDSATTNRRLKSQPHILAHLVLPDTQADPSQNQKS